MCKAGCQGQNALMAKLISAGAVPSSPMLAVGLLPGHTCGIDYPPWLAAAFLPATHLSARVTEEMAKGFHSWNKLKGKGRGGVERDKKTTLSSGWKKDGISKGNGENMCLHACACDRARTLFTVCLFGVAHTW